MKSISLATAGLVVIKDNKLLLAFSKNKKAWYLPGGKIDRGEDAVTALVREIEEELNVVLDTKLLTFYCHITAPAYGESPTIMMEQDCFIYELHEEIQPSNEIGAVKFFDYASYKVEPAQVVGVLDVFDRLTKDKLLG